MKLLNLRSFELKSSVHEVFDHIWKTLIHADIETRQFAIYNAVEGEETASQTPLPLTSLR